ncbi:hypothetical protein GLOIN_2v1775921 [Rhizophagus irregularis DAOM 181602=DAOM 197198]|uniref:Uncharacterized protein n=1 Tax=Rhizophagus irregularis (strain DAOM 181602 / DAOM 197198 / MUCL 43194) TaxID=747089 RepID=A0A2P4PYL0_RHIID|nr:hypothetical protein GLOIN_2v1775921 [Rhizophagus irregularis DAOM 181602=DAOM 197198]POG70450.1 hypothetical protein GLOIN_2v1775921 [Rhizophagus irregularis DAOM 181602=DAOM 197198]|eukprot:XP_025177316.1 hypothetical protein GLOIN_2v1775921 [Rhizophagus irregularis DAOM 181602=DAOM 197198]
MELEGDQGLEEKASRADHQRKLDNAIEKYKIDIFDSVDSVSEIFDDPLLSNFEYIAHNILNKGGWFDVRSLESTDDDPTDVQLAFTR